MSLYHITSHPSRYILILYHIYFLSLYFSYLSHVWGGVIFYITISPPLYSYSHGSLFSILAISLTCISYLISLGHIFLWLLVVTSHLTLWLLVVTSPLSKIIISLFFIYYLMLCLVKTWSSYNKKKIDWLGHNYIILSFDHHYQLEYHIHV